MHSMRAMTQAIALLIATLLGGRMIRRCLALVLQADGSVFEFTGHGELSSLRVRLQTRGYGVATISRLLKITGLVCKRAL